MLNQEQMCAAIELAMKIESYEVDFNEVLSTLKQDPLAAEYVAFWFCFNEMTRSALRTLVLAKCRMHLENCFNKSSY